MRYSAILSSLIFAGAATGCTSVPTNMPLVFGETLTVGISIAGTTVDQGADFTLGFKSKDVAVIPVSVLKTDGSVEKLKATGVAGTPPVIVDDAYSVIGQFSTDTSTTGQKVGLGKFFATGQAAQFLAEGFKAQLKASANDEQTPVNGN